MVELFRQLEVMLHSKILRGNESIWERAKRQFHSIVHGNPRIDLSHEDCGKLHYNQTVVTSIRLNYIEEFKRTTK